MQKSLTSRYQLQISVKEDRFQTKGQRRQLSYSLCRLVLAGGGGDPWGRGSNNQRLQEDPVCFPDSTPSPVFGPICFGAENCMTVGGEVWVPSLISLDKCRFMAERSVRNRRYLPGMAANPLQPEDPLGWGGKGQRSEQVQGLDSLYSFLDAHPFAARNGGLGGRRGRGARG